jgi:phosphoribosylformylglycinamidine synthase subunit PurQ / glutaminase
MATVAVIQFPGSNCDLDALQVLQNIVRTNADLVWHKDLEEDNYDAYVLPGGFSYGDFLRAGAIAAKSPCMDIIRKAAENQKPILGICNGFQILVEAGLLPGAVLRNTGLRFVCSWTRLRVENNNTQFTSRAEQGSTLRVPVAHNEGRYYIDEDSLVRLEEDHRIVFRYVDDENRPTQKANPNGSVSNIAGISNREGNIVGLMPHPERSSISQLSPDGQSYGRLVFDSMLDSLKVKGGS